MPPNTQPSWWGPEKGIDSKDYLFMLGAKVCTDYPLPLECHTLGSPTQDLTDPLTIPCTRLENGRIKTEYLIKRAAEETSRSYTLGFPSALWTPALDLARRPGGCRRDFFALYLCPESPEYGHFYVLPDAVLDPPIEANDFITVDDTTIIQETTTLRTTSREIKFRLFPILTNTIATELYAVDVAGVECLDCADGPNDYGVLGGGDGVAVYGANTDDRFATATPFVFPVAVPVAYYLTDIINEGSVIVATFADDPDPTAGAAGVVAMSSDGGATWIVPAALVNAYYGVAAYNGYFVVVGAGGELWRTRNGLTWEQSAQTITVATLTGISVDKYANLAYVSGLGGVALVLDDDQVTDLTAAVNAAGADLFAVHVLGKNHVAFGGEAGFYTEAVDITAANAFTQYTVGGTVDDIRAIKGTCYRTFVGAGTVIYERSLFTDMLYKAQPLEYGAILTGDIRDIDMGDDENMFVAVTDDGEVVVIRAKYPGA